MTSLGRKKMFFKETGPAIDSITGGDTVLNDLWRAFHTHLNRPDRHINGMFRYRGLKLTLQSRPWRGLSLAATSFWDCPRMLVQNATD